MIYAWMYFVGLADGGGVTDSAILAAGVVLLASCAATESDISATSTPTVAAASSTASELNDTSTFVVASLGVIL